MEILYSADHGRESKERIMKETIEILDVQSFSFQKKDFRELLDRIHYSSIEDISISASTKRFLGQFCSCKLKQYPIYSSFL